MLINSGHESLDEDLNLMLMLALLTMNYWSETVASVINTYMQNPGKQQLEIAAMMKKSQSTISEALKRGGFEEVKQMEILFSKKMAAL
jgi:predicted transcriptional regulator